MDQSHPDPRAEILAELKSLIRQSQDAARADEATAAAFKDEYEALCTAPEIVNHARMMEIYVYVVERPREAKRLRREATVFAAAAALIRKSLIAADCNGAEGE